jgi:hypothetical protein
MNIFVHVSSGRTPEKPHKAPSAPLALILWSSATLSAILCAAALLSSSITVAQVSAATPTAAATASPAKTTTTASSRSSSDNPPANTAADTIGVIEGESIAVSGPMSVEVVHGVVKTVLRSGSDVRVKSGSAQIMLVEGGVINICGPAHLSVLKAAGALTVALESGTVHTHIPHDILLTVYTPQIKVQPIAIGEEPQDMLVGFDNPGTMCIRATHGAARIEQQLTGQSVVIPQTGDVLLVNGQLDSLRTSSGLCQCEVQINDAPADSQPGPPAEVSKLATSEDIGKRSFDAKPILPPAPPAQMSPKEEPIYQVVVPPLVYIANAKVQPEIDPAMIILVRRVRVRPTVIFQGRVLDQQVSAASVAGVLASAAGASTKPQVTKPAPAKADASPTLADRMRTFINKIWPPTP